MIALDLTNRHLDLAPPVRAVCRKLDLHAVQVITSASQSPFPSSWALISADGSYLDSLRSLGGLAMDRVREMEPWTDEHAALFPVLKHQWHR